MKLSTCGLILQLIWLAASHGEEPKSLIDAEVTSLSELRSLLEGKLESDSAPITEFEQNYETRLKKIRDETQQRGEFEKLLVVNKELETYREERPRNYSQYPQLQKLRTIYDTNWKGILNSAVAKRGDTMRLYVRKLGELKKNLTQQGKVERAKEIAEEEKRIVALIVKETTDHSPTGSSTSDGPSDVPGAKFKRSGAIQLAETSEGTVLTGNGYAYTLREVKRPFRLTATIRTTGELRLYYAHAKELMIFNWTRDATQFRYHEDSAVRGLGVKDHGHLDPKEFHQIEWEFGERMTRVRVDRRVIHQFTPTTESTSSPVGVGPFGSSTITIKDWVIEQG